MGKVLISAFFPIGKTHMATERKGRTSLQWVFMILFVPNKHKGNKAIVWILTWSSRWHKSLHKQLYHTVCIKDTHKQLIFPYQVEFCFWKLLIITTIVCEKTFAKTRSCCVNHPLLAVSRKNHWWWRAASPFCKPVVTFEISCQLSSELPVFHI